jgi:long-chain acyl-CoA synthetase
MQGYWKRADETERVFRGSWFLTGDIARMTEDGYFQIVDRRKDMIIVGGLKVFPSEVEKVLLEHPAVQEAVVVGIPDPYRGEMVKAFVVLREGASVEPRELLAFCRERLAPHRVPREIEIRTELPKNLIGKVLRRKLIEEELAKRQASAPDTAPEV